MSTRARLAILTVLLAGGLAAVSWQWLRGGMPVPAEVVRASVPVPAELMVESPVISPDGSLLVYVGHRGQRSRLYARPLDAFDASEIAGTDGATLPFVAPDGSRVGFFAGGEVRSVRLPDGGQPDVLARVPAGSAGGSWTPDGDAIVASAETGGLLRIVVDREHRGTDAARDGAVVELTRPDPARDEIAHGWPTVISDGRAVLFTTSRHGRATRIAVLALETGEWTHLLPGFGRAYALPSGHVVYQLDDELLAVRLDDEALDSRGGPVTLLDGIDGAALAFGGLGHAGFSVSANGTLLYEGGREPGNRLVWVDRGGAMEALSDRVASHRHPRLSPDGGTLAVVVTRDVLDSGIWLHDVASDERVALADGGGDERAPAWSPGGRALAFASNREGAQAIFLYRPEASPVRLGRYAEAQNPASWSAGGNRLAFYTVDADRDRDIWSMPVPMPVSAPDGSGVEASPALDASPMLTTPHDERSPALSPDGRLLAYVSDESGRDGVHVRMVESVDAGPVASFADASEPVWTRDGRELLMRVGAALASVAVDPGSGELAVSPRLLFERPTLRDPGGHLPNYDVSLDGRRFVMIAPARPTTSLRLVTGWADEVAVHVAATQPP